MEISTMSHINTRGFATLLLLLLSSIASTTVAQTREEKVRGDREKIEADGFWIYNDLPKAFKQAEEEGKPIIVVLRCIPCEECVKLDDDLIDEDPAIQPLLKKFVRARQVSTNGLDLSLFQYDTDQSFAVFLLNADGTIYGRFGTRSHRTDWINDVSIQGLAKAMQGALALHANYDTYKTALTGKRGPAPEVASPEKYPHLKEKYTDTLNYKGDVVKSCIHCHQIGDAQRAWFLDQGKPIPEKIFFPYPHPKSIGLTLDPDEMATVKAVADNSPAAAAGLKAGDSILFFEKQPILSIADVQWVLHNADANGDELSLRVRREGEVIDASLSLSTGWRRNDDISWRVSSWPYRRMVYGGMKLETLSAEQRTALKLEDDQLGLLIAHVGQYGPHAAAKRAGIQKGDILVDYNGHTDAKTPSEMLHTAMSEHQPGKRISLTVLRNGERKTMQVPLQK